MVQLKSFRPILWTENLKESIDFYTIILGFSIDEYSEDWGWASLSIDEVGVMISRPNEHEDYGRIGFSGSFYFVVNNVDEMWEELKTKTKVCYGISDFPWEMREFAIYDNNGYILQFGQNL